MAYLPIACTENDRPPEQNPAATSTNIYAMPPPTICPSRRQLENARHSAPDSDRSQEAARERRCARTHPKSLSNIRKCDRPDQSYTVSALDEDLRQQPGFC
ncbi:hypothetical protein [Microcoleus sp. B4-D4]|uniref:hypothetical protein n=1 Tax=Microcoleus sp. B4-D4 TaxID=2818667 RepID=UPI002FD43828